MDILWNKFTLHSGLQNGFGQVFSKIGFKDIKFFFSGFEFVAEGHESIDGHDNALLFGKGWERKEEAMELINLNPFDCHSRASNGKCLIGENKILFINER